MDYGIIRRNIFFAEGEFEVIEEMEILWSNGFLLPA